MTKRDAIKIDEKLIDVKEIRGFANGHEYLTIYTNFADIKVPRYSDSHSKIIEFLKNKVFNVTTF